MAYPVGDNSLDEHQKRRKISSNYETIGVLREQLDERLSQERVGMSRSAYIKMIFDVSAKVDKQNEVLNKVVLDIRALQKDIGTLSSQLSRSYTSAEAAILQSSNRASWGRETLAVMGNMHDNCDQLVKATQEIGDIAREMKQLDDEVSQLKVRRRIASNM